MIGPRPVAGLEQIAGSATPNVHDRQSIIAAAGLLELGAGLKPKDPRWEWLARQIVAQRQGTGWGDTLTTSAAVRGLSAVLTAPPAQETPVAVFLDGRKIGELTAAGGNRHRTSGRPRRHGGAVSRPLGLARDFYAIEVQGRCGASTSVPSAPLATLHTRLFLGEADAAGGTARRAVANCRLPAARPMSCDWTST